jgi:hypothetical protein
MYEEVISAGRGVGSTTNLSTAITEAETKFRSIYDRLRSSKEIQKVYGIPVVDSTPPDDTTDEDATSGTGDGASAVETGVDGAPVVPTLPRPVDPYAENFQGQGGK